MTNQTLIPCVPPGIELPEPTAERRVVRLPPGRLLEVSAETARLLRLVDGQRDLDAIAARLTAETGTPVPVATIRAVFERTLVPAGIAWFGAAPAPRPAPGSRLWIRVPVLPARTVASLARPGRWLFAPGPATAAVAVLVIAHVAFLRTHPITAMTRAPFGSTAWLAGALLILAASWLHELGHAAALLAEGEMPGVIGIGMYGPIPVLFNDVTNAWRLPARRRLSVDLGGVYFQLLFAGALIVTGLAARNPRVVAAIGLISAVNLLPIFRFDGHWVLADLREHFGRRGAATQRRPRGGAPWLAARAAWASLQSRIELARGTSRIARRADLLPALLATSVGADEPLAKLRARVRRCVTALRVSELDHTDLARGARAEAVRGLEIVHAAAARGRGVLVCSLHAGPYHYVAAELARAGLQVNTLMVGRLSAERDAAWSAADPEARGRVRILESGRPSSLRAALRALRAGEVVVIYADAHAGQGGPAGGSRRRIPVTFLSVPLAMRAGPAYLALRAGAPVVVAAAHRDRWSRRIVTFGPALEPPGDEPGALAAFTRRLYAAFEPAVRREPDQWPAWLWPVFHWGTIGGAPTATVAEFSAERARIATLLRSDGGRARLQASPSRAGAAEVEPGEWVIFDAAQRRFLAASPLACALLRAGYRSTRVVSLPRRTGADRDALAPELARLTLAGLVTVE